MTEKVQINECVNEIKWFKGEGEACIEISQVEVGVWCYC